MALRDRVELSPKSALGKICSIRTRSTIRVPEQWKFSKGNAEKYTDGLLGIFIDIETCYVKTLRMNKINFDPLPRNI